MNKIKAGVDQGDFGDLCNFLNYRIDGQWLDETIDLLYPGHSYKGLVPTLDFALDGEEAKEIVWERIFPAEGDTTRCPILMCPDDCDFFCTLLVAEIENWGSTVVWKRIGLNKPVSTNPGSVGAAVEWLPKIGTLEFSREEYIEMLQAFKRQFEEEEEKSG